MLADWVRHDGLGPFAVAAVMIWIAFVNIVMAGIETWRRMPDSAESVAQQIRTAEIAGRPWEPAPGPVVIGGAAALTLLVIAIAPLLVS